MDLICAGFPKTGTKSCTNALRLLGYNVADIRETFLDLIEIWKDYFQGNATIEDVIGKSILRLCNTIC